MYIRGPLRPYPDIGESSCLYYVFFTRIKLSHLIPHGSTKNPVELSESATAYLHPVWINGPFLETMMANILATRAACEKRINIYFTESDAQTDCINFLISVISQIIKKDA